MAFSDDKRRFWQIDLTTRAGARSAAYQGSIACFFFCGMGVLGALFWGASAGISTTQGLSLVGGATFEAVVGLIAGLRLRAGKGAYWGMAVVALAALELIGKVLAISIMGIALTGIIVVMTVQGVRGALALKNIPSFEDDDIDVFG